MAAHFVLGRVVFWYGVLHPTTQNGDVVRSPHAVEIDLHNATIFELLLVVAVNGTLVSGELPCYKGELNSAVVPGVVFTGGVFEVTVPAVGARGGDLRGYRSPIFDEARGVLVRDASLTACRRNGQILCCSAYSDVQRFLSTHRIFDVIFMKVRLDIDIFPIFHESSGFCLLLGAKNK